MAGAVRLTYVGHATVLIELDGVRILTDPLLRSRIGLLRRRGPTPSPDDLGPVDAVVISHAHPDHFDRASIRLAAGDPFVVVPRGLGRAARHVGRNVQELAVRESVEVRGVRITAVPARHSRWPPERAARPVGYLIEASSGVYFAGDTATFPAMASLVGRVDVAVLPVGRWGPPVGPERLTPESAVDAARLVGAKVAVPIHWGTLHLPGFGSGRWGWGAFDAGQAFARAGETAPDLDVVVLEPGEERTIEV